MLHLTETGQWPRQLHKSTDFFYMKFLVLVSFIFSSGSKEKRKTWSSCEHVWTVCGLDFQEQEVEEEEMERRPWKKDNSEK